MSYIRNQANQQVDIILRLEAGGPFTGTPTVQFRQRGGSYAPGGGTVGSVGPDGEFTYTMTQAETNTPEGHVKASGTDATPVVVNIPFREDVNTSGVTLSLLNHTPQSGDSFARIGATGSGLTSLASAAAQALQATLANQANQALEASVQTLRDQEIVQGSTGQYSLPVWSLSNPYQLLPGATLTAANVRIDDSSTVDILGELAESGASNGFKVWSYTGGSTAGRNLEVLLEGPNIAPLPITIRTVPPPS